MGKGILVGLMSIVGSVFFSSLQGAAHKEVFNPLFSIYFSREDEPFYKKKMQFIIKNIISGIEKNCITDDFFMPDIHLWKDDEGRTLMHYAAAKNRLVISILFFLLGGDINAVDNNGNTPLLDALLAYEDEHEYSCVFFFNKTPIPPSLLRKIVKILDTIDSRYGLHNFTSELPLREHVDDTLKFLIIYSDEISRLNKDGFSAYDFFCVDGLKLLLEHFFYISNKTKVNELTFYLIQRKKEELERKKVDTKVVILSKEIERTKSL